MDSGYAGKPVRAMDWERAAESTRRTARRLAADAGFSLTGAATARSFAGPDRNRDGGAQCVRPLVKTPKYSGRADWEAFHAQFEILARAADWSEDDKALQLAMCLNDEALSCLLQLSPAEREDYGALVGALQRRFGQSNLPGVLRAELTNRQRQPGEPLRVLANDIETLARKAYAHMPTAVQNELARDQFIRALSPRGLRVQTQLAHPSSLQEALELAVEREAVGAAAEGDQEPVARAMVHSSPGQEKPAWAAELTELIRAVSLHQTHNNPSPHRSPPVCWTCGQQGHISRGARSKLVFRETPQDLRRWDIAGPLLSVPPCLVSSGGGPTEQPGKRGSTSPRSR